MGNTVVNTTGRPKVRVEALKNAGAGILVLLVLGTAVYLGNLTADPATGVWILAAVAAFLGAATFWVMFLVEALRVPDHVWRAVGHSKLAYVAVMVVLGLVGTVVYLVAPRGAILAELARRSRAQIAR